MSSTPPRRTSRRPRFLERLLRWSEKIRSLFSGDPLLRCRWIRFPSTRNSDSGKEKDRLARAGEDEALRLLEEKGYVLLHRNLRFPEGELDLVLRQNRTVVFVEVKPRRDDFVRPWETVSPEKRKRQILMARRFLALCRLDRIPFRFDVITIHWPENGEPRLRHDENAFRPGDFSTVAR